MLKIYDAPRSGHAHRARLGASLLGLEFESVAADGLEGGRKGAEFLALNPFGQIPVLVDGNMIVRDSNAILIYLAEKYDQSGQWLPADLSLRTEVHEWLAVAAGHMFRGPNLARLVKVFNAPADYDAAVAVSKQLFEMMDTYFADRTWLVGDNATIADISCYPYVALADEGEISLEPYINIRRWLAEVEGLENFLAMPRPS